MRTRLRGLGVLAALLAAVLLPGCGGNTTVKGRLLDDGKPLSVSDKGVIVVNFIPEGQPGQSFGATVKPDGTFVVNGPDNKGIPPGKYHISVEAFDPYPGNDKLGGKYQGEKSPVVRDVTGSGSVDVDLAKPQG